VHEEHEEMKNIFILYLFFMTFVLFVISSIVPQACLRRQAVMMTVEERRDAKA
jgi:hypothetical protein